MALDPHGIEKILVSAHGMISAYTGAPHWKMETEEARSLGEALANVTRHYKALEATQKTLDIVNFATLFGMSYGSRLMASVQNKKKPTGVQRAPVNPVAHSQTTQPIRSNGTVPPEPPVDPLIQNTNGFGSGMADFT